jgi:hypothetical protein
MKAMATQPTVPEGISRVVAVKKMEGEKLNIVLDDCWGHHHKMLRDKNEMVSKTLNRLVLSSVKSQRRKVGARKRKRTDLEGEGDAVAPPIEAHLYAPSGDAVDGEIPNEVAWENGGVLRLGSVDYKVCVNPPTVVSLTLPRQSLTTGSPIVPQVGKK